MMRYRLISAALLVLLSACGVPSSTLSDNRVSPSGELSSNNGPPVDWDRPFGDEGRAVTSVEEARAYLAFEPRRPERLGSARSIFVLSPGSRSGKGLIFVYELPEHGRALLSQRPLEMTPGEWEQNVDRQVARNGEHGVLATAEKATIRGGIQALILTENSTGRSAIEWTEEGVRLVVMGPALSREDCLAIAEQV